MRACSLCMGNQAGVRQTRLPYQRHPNFPTDLGFRADVSSLLRARSRCGDPREITDPTEYLTHAEQLDTMASDIYRYLNFNEIIFSRRSNQALIPAVNVMTV